MTSTTDANVGDAVRGAARSPGVEEVCELRSTFGLMAFHGGNLEQATDHDRAAGGC